MNLLLLSLFGGALTVLSPCVLPVLPVILAGSLSQTNKRRPLIIVTSLTLSIVLFTLLLKWSTSFIFVSSEAWQTLSGSILILLGLFTLFPRAWDSIVAVIGIERLTQRTLNASTTRSSWVAPILIGASLGPVFSSCSPTYALILATVLPQTFALGVLNLLAYAIGLAGVLLLIALFGQRAVTRLRFASNPRGWFRHGLGILFIIIGILIFFGLDKKIETSLIANGLGVTRIEQELVSQVGGNTNNTQSNTSVMNVKNPKAAPALVGLTNWINGAPLTLESLKGKVVLIDFWTYSCINCLRTLPTLERWYNTYTKDGLVIIGVHAPEFAFEHIPSNVEKAVGTYGITYPVALDNDFSTWRAYNNRYWPATYFIDRDGKLRHTHFGEGSEAENEQVIRALLAEQSSVALDSPTITQDEAVSVRRTQTPETYLGYARADQFENTSQRKEDTNLNYTFNNDPRTDYWALNGSWNIHDEKITSTNSTSTLTLNFSAKSVYLVITPTLPEDITMTLNGKPVTAEEAGADAQNDTLHVDSDKLYHLIELPEFTSHQILTLTVPSGISVHAFTFGS